ncbi:hypothetical protein VZT92_027364 [Zoarces viviparus]|uniref:Uncharacterized protein n=1 Tax=Zoarces viviparus TaxID=48416 RepID=A0AAW1DUL0_ZOAVI
MPAQNHEPFMASETLHITPICLRKTKAQQPAKFKRGVQAHLELRFFGELTTARRQPRRPARSPRERDPTGTVAGEIREKGPARVQSRRHRPPNPIPSTGPPSTRRQTPPPENLRNSDAVRHHRQRPREAGRATRFQRRREAGDGMTAPPAARLFTLETCCGYGYGLARDLHLLPRIFKGQRELTGRRRNRDAFQGTGPSLGANPFQGALPFTKKRELSPGLPPASPGSFALPHWAPRGAYLRHSRFGDLNPTPFRSAGGDVGHRPTLQNGVRPSLRTD